MNSTACSPWPYRKELVSRVAVEHYRSAMDGDKSRPLRRPPAAAAKRAQVRRPRNLARPELDAAPQRMVRDLHEKAGKPALEDRERRIACSGGRLVLIVDGLDEDRGVTTGPHARSIAALLPGVPPAGMRVIVAGRPDPPVPDDVPDWHPLREQSVIRPLAGSPYAGDLQRLGQTELKRLLTGSQVKQDLLGLLTAARGGLSSDDLHELTGTGLVEVEEVLHTVAGRTFTRRSQQWGGGAGPLVYLLGHEELDAAARRYLGGTRLTDYRDRLQCGTGRRSGGKTRSPSSTTRAGVCVSNLRDERFCA